MTVSNVLTTKCFLKICALNLSLQRKGDILTRSNTVTAFCKKVMLFREGFENGYLDMFPLLCNPVAKKKASVAYKNYQVCTHTLAKRIS